MRNTQALRHAREQESDPYKRRFTWPKWTRTVTVCDVPQLFRALPEFADWTRDRHAQVSADYLAYAHVYERTAGWLMKYGEKHYGGDGALIAGGFRENWPDALKDAIRVHSYGATAFRDKSAAHWRAAGRTLATWRRVNEDTAQGVYEPRDTVR